MLHKNLPQMLCAAGVRDQAVIGAVRQQFVKTRIDLDTEQFGVRWHGAQDRPGNAAGAGAQFDYGAGRGYFGQCHHTALEVPRARNDRPDLTRIFEKLLQKDDSIIRFFL